MGPSLLGLSKLYKALTKPKSRAQRARVRCVHGSGPTSRAAGGTPTLSLSTVSGQRTHEPLPDVPQPQGGIHLRKSV
eukprot:6135482-Prymnesium_polylepis.1